MKKGCNQCGKPLKDCGHRTLQELMTSKVNMQEEIENILLRIDLTYKETAKLIEALIKKHERELIGEIKSMKVEKASVLNGKLRTTQDKHSTLFNEYSTKLAYNQAIDEALAKLKDFNGPKEVENGMRILISKQQQELLDKKYGKGSTKKMLDEALKRTVPTPKPKKVKE